LVTGATGRIGLHIARQFADRAWTVQVGARDSACGEEAAAQVSGHAVLLDVTDADTIAVAAKTVPSSTSWSTTPASRSVPDHQ
jgi:NAD(P)-dependent dehydrogenase (short-subunit alcohol dehydrogenase family)